MRALATDNDLKLQLMEATQALFRAAIALESVESAKDERQGFRCPYVPSGDIAGALVSDAPSELSVPDLDALIAIDERSGYKAMRRGSGDVMLPGEADPGVRFGHGGCREISHVVHVARLALRDALPRVSDGVAEQRIETALGLLDHAIEQLRDLGAGLGERERSAT